VPSASDPFDYATAFSRNLGWVTESEQRLLRQKRVAIAGLGGAGGSHLLTLTRLGIGAFHVADLDAFELVNFNRQAGAAVSTLGRPKVDTMIRMARDIQPDLRIEAFPHGVDASRADAFLDGVDVYVDGLDFFAFDARRAVFAACARKGIPAVTAAPLGMGAAVLVFMPGGMTFEEYFQLEGRSEADQSLRFLLGLAPAALYARHLVDRTRVDLGARSGPSTAIACELCAGVAAAQVLKILLQRGDVIAAPRGLHFDAYANKLARTHVRGGNRNPWQRVKLWAAAKVMAAQPRRAVPAASAAASGPGAAASAASQERPETTMARVLDAARWAPSGDNTQVWRFEITGPRSCRVHTHDTRERVVYDLDGHASHLAVGALLESLRIAASELRCRTTVIRAPADDAGPAQVFDVVLTEDAAVSPDPLAPYLAIRSVQRKRLSTRALTAGDKAALEAAAGPGYGLTWLESTRDRWSVARLLHANTKLRLTTPEAFEVHCSAIEWNAQFSADRMPDEALGLGAGSLVATRWAMQSWERVAFLNTYLAGASLPGLELDVIPALGCAAHFLIVAERAPRGIDDHVAAGRAMQRVWLTATRLGLQMQPETTPLIFAAYVRAGRPFSRAPGAKALFEQARGIAAALARLVGAEPLERAVFMARIGHGPAAAARSTRKTLARLTRAPAAAGPGSEQRP
jgi:molybdopterin/thiamine biosynthesis adenylyltransferase/nitroreductase